MKIQLDTANKTIKVEEPIKLIDFFNAIKTILPNNLWKEFTLDVTPIAYWTSPYILKEVPYYPPISPSYPWIITCGTSSTSGDYTINNDSGVHNIQC